MRLLLDTCALLWLRAADPRVSPPVKRACEDPLNQVHLSAASANEIALKYGLGKLQLPENPGAYVARALQESDLLPLDITIAHGLEAGCLPFHNRDPFDRLLAAQCKVEGLTIVSRDPVFGSYGVPTLW